MQQSSGGCFGATAVDVRGPGPALAGPGPQRDPDVGQDVPGCGVATRRFAVGRLLVPPSTTTGGCSVGGKGDPRTRLSGSGPPTGFAPSAIFPRSPRRGAGLARLAGPPPR